MYWCWRVPPVLSWCVRNKAMKYLSILALLWPLSAWACEPVSFDWQAFMQANDHNRDGALQRSELVGADFSGSNYSHFEQDPAEKTIFARLDTNGDGKLSDLGEGANELGGLYFYLPDPCAGWPWTE